MKRTIKIAPDMDEIRFNGVNVFSCDFPLNSDKKEFTLRYIMTMDEGDLDESQVVGIKQCLQAAIAMSSKTWQIDMMMRDAVRIQGEPAGRVETVQLI